MLSLSVWSSLWTLATQSPQPKLWSDWVDAKSSLGAQVILLALFFYRSYEPWHDKTNKMSERPAKTQIGLGMSPVWSESSLCAQWVAKGLRFLHADSEDSDQTGRMPKLIWVFAGHTVIFDGFVVSWLISNQLGWLRNVSRQQNDCAPSEDSDQPGHPPSLIRVFVVRMKKPWAPSYVSHYTISLTMFCRCIWAKAQQD